MRNWNPDLASRTGPRYRAIAEAIAEDIDAGRLSPGSQLPPQRDLARSLGVTVGTITRAYSEAERRGLVRGEVGRGTFVRAGLEDSAGSFYQNHQHHGEQSLIDLSMSIPSTVRRREERTLLEEGYRRLARYPDLPQLSGDQPPSGAPRFRRAGASFLGELGIEVEAEQVLVTCGAQHAMTAVFSTLTRPGDVVLTEEVTFPGMKGLANLLSLRLEGLPMDADGLLPDAFERACRDGDARILYTIPTLQNPTCSVMPEDRRREIAKIAQRHGVAVVEDEVYGHLLPEHPTPLAALAPEHGFLLSSTSKLVAPGVRIGFLAAPKSYVDRLGAAIWATASMAPHPMAALVADWIERGDIARFVAWRREESALRWQLAQDGFHGRDLAGHPCGFHVWLLLPEPWRAADFVMQAKRRGVSVTASEVFAAGRAEPVSAIRVSLTPVADIRKIEQALRILDDLLDEPVDPCALVV